MRSGFNGEVLSARSSDRKRHIVSLSFEDRFTKSFLTSHSTPPRRNWSGGCRARCAHSGPVSKH